MDSCKHGNIWLLIGGKVFCFTSFLFRPFFSHSFIHSFIHSFMHSFFCSFIHSSIRSFIPLFIYSSFLSLFPGTASGTLGSTVTSYRDYISKAALDRDNIITFDRVRLSFVGGYEKPNYLSYQKK